MSPVGHLVDVHVELRGEEPQDGEDDAGGDERGEKVQRGDHGGVDVHLVAELVVRAEHHQAAPARGGNDEEEENLIGGFLDGGISASYLGNRGARTAGRNSVSLIFFLLKNLFGRHLVYRTGCVL